MKAKKKKPVKKICQKCGDGQRCHFCGASWDNRGFANSWQNKKGGPMHYICPSCAD